MSLLATVHQPFKVVSVNDPAIDRESLEGLSALQIYRRERDLSVLEGHYIAGAKPTVFHCRPLSHHARLWCEMFTGSMRLVTVFRVCVTRIENLEGFEPPWRPSTEAASWVSGKDETILDEDCMARLGSAPGLGKIVEEIGAVCLQKATLLPSQKKAFLLPPGFVVETKNVSPATSQESDPPREGS